MYVFCTGTTSGSIYSSEVAQSHRFLKYPSGRARTYLNSHARYNVPIMHARWLRATKTKTKTKPKTKTKLY